MRLAITLLLLALTAAAQAPTLSLDLDTTPWRYFDGDNPDFARPDFDDSTWPQMPVPARRNGYRWFRKQVTIPAWADTSQLTFLTANLPAFIVYIDGFEIGATGSLTDFREYSGFEPRRFDIPPGVLRPGTTARIAIRSRYPFFQHPRSIIRPEGSFRIVSREIAPGDAGAHARAKHWLRFGPSVLMAGIFLAMALISAAAWRFTPDRPDLFWFAGLCLVWFSNALSPLLPVLQWRHYQPSGISILAATDPGVIVACFTFSALRLRQRWPHILAGACWACVLVLSVLVTDKEALRWPFYGISVVLAAAGLIAILADWTRNHTRLTLLERALRLTLFAKILLDLFDWTVRVAAALRNEATYFVPRLSFGPMQIDTDLTLALLIAVVLFTMLIRTVAVQRDEQRRLASELEAARTVQQLLLPTATPANLDAVYLPAAEVGGDFWHVFDNRLIVVGDVSGKGLKAAMIVSIITGALRNRHSDQPASILAELNHILLGGPGFVTCSIARLDGATVTIANAGHPAPYLDGHELDLPAGLPLGLAPDSEYTEITMPLTGSLTLLSDGVPEAANSKGELLGFDRTAALSTKPAREIAEAARAWGQTDDITVVTIQRRITATA